MDSPAHESPTAPRRRRAARRRGRITRRERAWIVGLAETGWSVDDIAERVRRRREAVRHVLTSAGRTLPPARPGPPPRPVDTEALVTDYRDHGLSVRACAIKYRIAADRVRAVLTTAGLEVVGGKPGPKPAAIDVQALVTDYRDHGLSIRACAIKYHIGPRRARALLTAAGVEIRPPKGRPRSSDPLQGRIR